MAPQKREEERTGREAVEEEARPRKAGTEGTPPDEADAREDEGWSQPESSAQKMPPDER
jgi:hypothetical protein